MSIEQVLRANIIDAERGLNYLDEIATREIIGMSVVRNALGNILTRCQHEIRAAQEKKEKAHADH